MSPSSRGFLISSLFLSNVLLSPAAVHAIDRRYDTEEIEVDEKKHAKQFFEFVTRPDIDAPKWNITLHNQSALSPGYWFLAPYGIVNQTSHGKAYVGPHIYDSSGDLIWSGAPTFKGYDAFDFKVSNVFGRNMLTAIWPHKGVVAILDDTYEIVKTIGIGDEDKYTLNIHELQTIENGTKAIFATRMPTRASNELSMAVGYDLGECNVEFDGFKEIDLESGEMLFEWSSEGHIGLDESIVDDDVYRKCSRNGPSEAWDYFHINSISKLPSSDYLISGRRTYALYLISHLDGSILWRLGGKNSSFEWRGNTTDAHFSGQHDARFLSQNNTHMLISIMDNAKGPANPEGSSANSRGLVLALQATTDPTTAEIVAKYNHPHGPGAYAPARGNFQTLPNGNAFLGWTTGALHSEHAPNGTVLMEASLFSGLKSYRNYKMEWTGRPRGAPDVVSRVMEGEAEGKGNMTKVETRVWVSWNGDTRVRIWRAFATGPEGLKGGFTVLGAANRTGFETMMRVEGHAQYVVVKGLDADGHVLGASEVVRTVRPGETWVDEMTWDLWLVGILVVVGFGFLLCWLGVGCALRVWRCVMVRKGRRMYGRVGQEDTDEETDSGDDEGFELEGKKEDGAYGD